MAGAVDRLTEVTCETSLADTTTQSNSHIGLEPCMIDHVHGIEPLAYSSTVSEDPYLTFCYILFRIFNAAAYDEPRSWR
jgi:hypothetical protein